MQQKKKWVIPDNPAVLVPQRKKITSLGTEIRQVGELDKKSKEGEDSIEGRAHLEWKKREDTGYGSVHSNMQLYSATKLESLIGVKILQYCSVDMNEAGTEKSFFGCTGWLRESVMARGLLTQMPGQTAGAREMRKRLTGTHVRSQTI